MKLNGELQEKLKNSRVPVQTKVPPVTPVEVIRVGGVVAMPTPTKEAMATGKKTMAYIKKPKTTCVVFILGLPGEWPEAVLRKFVNFGTAHQSTPTATKRQHPTTKSLSKRDATGTSMGANRCSDPRMFRYGATPGAF